MKNYKNYQVIFFSIIMGKDSKIVIATSKINAINIIRNSNKHVTILECINISK